ncbi:MAG: hypothetical protein DCC67_01320 [Planctomycetota bacterium]|nr:MAG: hypothetical protein DCC67_01320 [Planctomycetota bacterium]
MPIHTLGLPCLLIATLLSACSTPSAAEPLALPATFDFTAAELPEQWEVVQPDGTSVAAKDRLLAIQSPADRHAGVRRTLGVDNVTVTARIHDAATVYLAWDDRTFVGTGKISPTPFARFHSIDAAAGRTTDVDHTGCPGYAAHLMRIQLGQDCIRFQYAAGDGPRQWRTLRTIERKAQYAGPPALVVVGKNFGIAQNAATLVPTDSVGRGNRGLLARVEIEATPADALHMNDDERRWLTEPRLDPVAQLLADGQRDPTFEEVARYHPEMKFKREIVGVPGHPLDIGTDWLGRLDASPWEGPVAWFEIGDERAPFADKPESVRRRLLDGYVPIVTLNSQREEVDYEMTVFGWADDFSPTADLYAYVRLTAWAGGETARLPKTIALAGRDHKQVALAPAASPAGAMTLCLRFKHPNPQTAEQISEAEFEAARAQAERAWRDLLAKCASFKLPDGRVDQAYRAWLAYSMLNADRVDGQLRIHDGAGFYDLQFGYSVALHAMALDLYRMPEYVADVLAAQVRLQKPDGHYLQECGLPDHGGFTLSLATHYLVTKDSAWMKAHAEPLKRACEWILARRAEAPAEGMCRGLIKFRPYNDYNDPVFNYQGNIYCCQGLEAAAAALGDVGDADAARRYAAEAVSYRQDILDSMDAATIVRDGVRMIPIEPDTHRLLKLTKYRGGEYYGLVASTLMENEFFAKDDHRADLLIGMLENRGGLAAGVCEFQEGIDHAYACGYLMNRLRAGEIRKTLLGFWSFMAYGMSRDTYSPVEVTLYKSGDNHYTLPHTYSCTQQLRLLRCLLLDEEDGDLVIARGVPSAWLEPSKRIEAMDAPTLFGPVSFRIETKDSRTALIRVDPPTRTPPREIRIHLRHPAGWAIAAAKSSRGPEPAIDGHVLRLAGLAEPVDMTVEFAASN